jgi:hypothetical protein
MTKYVSNRPTTRNNCKTYHTDENCQYLQDDYRELTPQEEQWDFTECKRCQSTENKDRQDQSDDFVPLRRRIESGEIDV